jgi:hypothetical protein
MQVLTTRGLRAALALLVLTTSLMAVSKPASAQETEPAYPSPEWFQREAENFATVSQAPAEQAADPDFQLRWNQQSTENRQSYTTRR